MSHQEFHRRILIITFHDNFLDAACSELNGHLIGSSYLVGQSLSLADLVVFYALSDIMKQLSPQEKEQYLNLSRWYDHLQQQDDIRQGSSFINLSAIHLLACSNRA